MKLLSDKEDLEKLYGKISIGFLLVQDFIAIIVIIIVSSFSNGGFVASTLAFTFLRGIVIVGLLIPIGYFVLPRLDYFFAKSQEFLFIFALAWGLGLSALFFYAGLSIEVGALIAGVLLSMSPYNYEISSKLRPLRDFFIISFFILLGSQMIFVHVSKFILPILFFSLFVIIGNPIILLILMGMFGYDKKNSFLVGLSVAQISEFSWILILLGVKVGHLEPEILSLVTVIGMITIAASSYLIVHGDRLYNYVSPYLPFFKRKKIHETFKHHRYEYFLLGENRIGFSIMKSFDYMKKKYVVVDYNPERVRRLKSMGIPCLYGDASDIEFLEDLRIDRAKVVVSTIPEAEVNMTLLRKIRKNNKQTIIIVTARQISDAFEFYKAGADYVVMPHFLGGSYIAKIIEKYNHDKDQYAREKKKHLRELRERLGEGHEHPHVDKDRKGKLV
jgi:voltage-gated potassium channel Kch